MSLHKILHIIFIMMCFTTIIFFIIYDSYKALPDGLLHIYFLDVGQGDATLIQTPQGKYILIDAGKDTAKLEKHLDKILPWFQKKLDLLIITHPDKDHYYGMTDILHKFNPKQVFLPSIQKQSSQYKNFIEKAQIHSHIQFIDTSDDLYIENNIFMNTLLPLTAQTSQHYKNHNNGSIVQQLIYNNISILFTGDLEKEGVEMITKLYKKSLKSNILKVSHHGAENGTTEDFMEYVKPSLATISAGENNSYGHPRQEVLDILTQNNTTFYNTADFGTIEIITNGNNIFVKTSKK